MSRSTLLFLTINQLFLTALVNAGATTPQGCSGPQETGTFGDPAGPTPTNTFQRIFTLPGQGPFTLEDCVSQMKADSPGSKGASLKIGSGTDSSDVGLCLGTFPENEEDDVALFRDNNANTAWTRCPYDPVDSPPDSCTGSAYWGNYTSPNGTATLGTVDPWDLGDCIQNIQLAVNNRQTPFNVITPTAAVVTNDGFCYAVLGQQPQKDVWNPVEYYSCQVAFTGAGWSAWGLYSACGATQPNKKTRTRSCPGGSGAQCPGPSSETIACGWLPWSEWQSCVLGRRTRTRICAATDPTKPATDCPFTESSEAETCAWSAWGPYGSCNIALKTKFRTRTCPDGADCVGVSTEGTPCGWENWAPWQPCQPGNIPRKRTRTRTCLGGAAAGDCPGVSQDEGSCGWGEWGDQMPCTDGYKTTVRTCLGNPNCDGSASKPCTDDDACDGSAFDNVGCGWEPFGPWTLCINGAKSQTRTCASPNPVDDCPGSSKNVDSKCKPRETWSDWSGCNYNGDAQIGRRQRNLVCTDGPDDIVVPCLAGTELVERSRCKLFCDDVLREYEYQDCIGKISECDLADDNAPYFAQLFSNAKTCECLQRIMDCFYHTRCFKKDWCLARVNRLNKDLIAGAGTFGTTACNDLNCDGNLRPMCEGNLGKFWMGVNPPRPIPQASP